MRLQRSLGFGEHIYKLNNSDKATFYTPIEARVMPAPTSKRNRGARIRSRFRSINAHDEQKKTWAQMNWTLCESPQPLLWYSLPMGSAHPRGGTSFRSRSKPFRDCAITRGNVSSPIVWKNYAKTTDTPMSGSAVKNHCWPKKGRQLYAKRTISYLLSFQGYPPILEAFRPLHRHRRAHQVHLHVQCWSESDGIAPGNSCGTSKTQNKNKKRDDRRNSDDRLRDLP